MARRKNESTGESMPQGVYPEKIFSSPELFEKLLDTLEWRATDSAEELERRAEQTAALLKAHPPE